MTAEEFREAWGRHMASREWQLLRRQVFDRAHGQCERGCGTPATDVHHLTYRRRFHERPEDLLAVCRPCHTYLSGRSHSDPAASRRPQPNEKILTQSRQLLAAIQRQIDRIDLKIELIRWHEFSGLTREMAEDLDQLQRERHEFMAVSEELLDKVLHPIPEDG